MTATPQKPRLRKVITPAGLVLLLALASLLIHNHAWRLAWPALTKTAGHLSFALFLLTTCFGSLYVYSAAYSRGASAAQRIAASLLTPLAYIIFEVIRATQFFTWTESLYYSLCPSNLFILLTNVGCMGLAETICRLRQYRQNKNIRPLSPIALTAILLALAAAYIIFLWGRGTHWFYIYQHAYKTIFT